MIHIYTANWIFYFKQSPKEKERGKKVKTLVVRDIVTKKIPVQFIINERDSYNRAISKMADKTLSTLEDDRTTGLKKFTIEFNKKIGEAHERRI